MTVNLNKNAAELCEAIVAQAERLHVAVASDASGVRLIDCGIDARGGLEAGRMLARVCLADLATVELVPGNEQYWPGMEVVVRSDHPVAACMASQYAGWEVRGEGFFAMGSGPMRAAAGREPLFQQIGYRESGDVAVGVLETRKVPPTEICRQLAERCGVEPGSLTLLLAPTASQAAAVQIVARSVETTLHKLHELGFDLARVESGFGVAPLPPVAENDLAAIGRTNDAILYAGRVTLWVRGDDESLEQIGPRVPSSASPDHGRPFAEIFEQYDHDFYKIDPHLFSPAVITLVNLDTGHTYRYGHTLPEVIHESFAR